MCEDFPFRAFRCISIYFSFCEGSMRRRTERASERISRARWRGGAPQVPNGFWYLNAERRLPECACFVCLGSFTMLSGAAKNTGAKKGALPVFQSIAIKTGFAKAWILLVQFSDRKNIFSRDGILKLLTFFACFQGIFANHEKSNRSEPIKST